MKTQIHYLVMLSCAEQFGGEEHWKHDKLWDHLRKVGRPMVKRLLDSGLPCQITTHVYGCPPTVTQLHFGPPMIGKRSYLDKLLETLMVIGPDEPAL